MDRHFAFPIAIAAVVHGVLFGIPRGTKPIPPSSEVPAIRAVPAPAEVLSTISDNQVSTTPESRPDTSLPRPPDLPEAPVIDESGPGIRVPIELSHSSGTGSLPTAIPAIDFRDGGLRDGRGGPAIAGTALDRPPHARLEIPPEYPPRAKAEGREGSVTVEFLVDEAGGVLGPRVITSSDPIFEAAAVRAVARWRFEPGTVHNRIVRFRMALPIVFRLSAD